jgi:hypothetical protein
LPQELRRLQSLLQRGLADTAPLWPDGRAGYHWVHRTAHILSNHDQREALTVQRRLGGLLGAMTRHQSTAGTLTTVPDLPRTNNRHYRG